MRATLTLPAALLALPLLAGCGRESGGEPGGLPSTDSHYPEEKSFDTTREAPPAMPAPMDTAIRRVPEAGKRLDAGDTGVVR